MLDDNWQDKVLGFWFDELTPKQWYQSTQAIDNTIRQKFEPLITRLAKSTPNSLGSDPRVLLASTIVLDQFPRNIYRGSANAFAFDNYALAITTHTVSCAFDRTMTQSEKQFCYMPFMHAENLDSQNKAVELFTKVGVKEGIDAAIEHRDIIVQFGRFPHRNEVLKRQSTQEEIQYLSNAKRFGQ